MAQIFESVERVTVPPGPVDLESRRHGACGFGVHF